MAKNKRRLDEDEPSKEIIYKCVKCSYILYKKVGESPPTFCPNCAINYLKGEMIRIERSE